MAPRLVILGWDSATFDVIDPLVSEGRLPAFADLQRRGFRAPLRSTWPPMTDCAWTSAFTGRNPGAHGIFGSWYRAPGAYACRYFSSRDRRVPAVWELAPDLRWAVLGVPMTYPPSGVNGAMVASYGAPRGATFCEPPGLQQELARRWPLRELMDRAPHSSLERFFEDLVSGVRAQCEVLVWLAERTEADCAVAVFPQIDRAQHFFWRFRRTRHPLEPAVDRVYEALDEATARVIEAFDEADVIVVSDHGAGDLTADVNIGAWLARRGWASYRSPSRSGVVSLAWALPPPARRLAKQFAPGLARRAFEATLAEQLGPFDWSRTHAFVGFHGDLWLNLKGREPHGAVEPAHAGDLLDDLSENLLGLVDPRSGRRVFAAVHRRNSVYEGEARALAPDAVLDSWTAGYRVAPRRTASGDIVVPPAALAGVGEAWSADHRPIGVFVAAGPHIMPGRADELALYDLCPTVLALLERPVPSHLDGRVAVDAFDPAWNKAHPVATAEGPSTRSTGGDYSKDEAAAIAAHLRDLGYIE